MTDSERGPGVEGLTAAAESGRRPSGPAGPVEDLTASAPSGRRDSGPGASADALTGPADRGRRDSRAAAPGDGLTVPPPAPGADQHPALDLANTPLALTSGEVDLLATPAAAAAWLTGRGLAPPDAAVFEQCAGRLRTLRDHIRGLLSAQVLGRPPSAADLEAVNVALTRAPSSDVLRWDAERGLHRAAAHPIDQMLDRALAVIAADAADLLTGPAASRLAACGSPPCRRFLLRTHKARHWCSVRCGDRARAARAYARRREPAS